MNHSFRSETSPENSDSYLRYAPPRKTDPSSLNFPPGFTPSDELYSSTRPNVFLDTTGLYSTEALDPRNRTDPRGSLTSRNNRFYYDQRSVQHNFPSRSSSKTIWSTDSSLDFNHTLPKHGSMYEGTTRAEVNLLPSDLLENQARFEPTTDRPSFSYSRTKYHNTSQVQNQLRYNNNNTIRERFTGNGESFGNHAGGQHYGVLEESSKTLRQIHGYNERSAGTYKDVEFHGDPGLAGNIAVSRGICTETYLNDGNTNVGNDNLGYQSHHYADRRQGSNLRFSGNNARPIYPPGWDGFGNPTQEAFTTQQRTFQTNNLHFDAISRGMVNNNSITPPPTQPRISGRMGKCTNPELLSLYNPKNFNTAPINARYFVIKSFTEDDVHKSLKYHIWTSTEMGNRRLDRAFKENSSKGPIYLFFSVNGSGHFCGVAQMLTPLDYSTNSTVWAQNKWKGIFNLKWIFVKDIPNAHLRHILVPLNCNKPVTNSRDTQELNEEAGQEMLKMFLEYRHKASILDDFEFYEKKVSEMTNNTTTDHTHRESGYPAASMARSSSLSSYHSNSSA